MNQNNNIESNTPNEGGYTLNDLYNDRSTAKVSHNRVQRTPTYDSVNDIPSVRAQNDQHTPNIQVNSSAGHTLSDNVHEVSSFDIAPAAEPVHTNDNVLSNMLGPLDSAMDRIKHQIDETHEQFYEEIDAKERENALSEEINDSEIDVAEAVVRDTREKSFVVKTSNVEEEEITVDEIKSEEPTRVKMTKSFNDELDAMISDSDDSDDFMDSDDEDSGARLESDLNDAEMSKKSADDMKSKVKELIQPIQNKIDLSKFTVSKKAKSVSGVLKNFTADINAANHPLPYGGSNETFTALSATSIMNLDPRNHANKSRLNAFRAVYKEIYDHIITPGKPNFEQWMRITLFHDLDHIYFGLFAATFGDTAFSNNICEKKSPENPDAKGCGYQFIADHKPMDYIKFRDDEAKAKFMHIMDSESTKYKDEYEINLIQITDDIVFGIRMPSIYNVILETASLPLEFTQKFSNLLEVFSYIDEIYFIDQVNQELVPVKYEEYENDQRKTTASRMQAYSKIYDSISGDQQNNLMKEITNLEKSYDIGVSYVMPEDTCPECGTVIAERAVDTQALLFTRHQLGRMAAI